MECKFESPYWVSVEAGLSKHNIEPTKGSLCERLTACRKGMGGSSCELQGSLEGILGLHHFQHVPSEALPLFKIHAFPPYSTVQS